MNDIEQLRATSLDDEIETYQLLKMVLQRMTRNKKYTQEVRNGAMKELDATRGILRSLIDKRDNQKAATGSLGNTEPEPITETTTASLIERGIL